MSDTYKALAAHFDRHHKLNGLDYVSGEQVIGRLNEVLGPGGWSFVVKDYGYDVESDEVWAIGHLEAVVDGVSVVREQFGSQRHNRRKTSAERGPILDYGFDSKGAATDSLKKCATLIGVGLYLSEKEGGVPQEEAGGVGHKTNPTRQPARPPAQPRPEPFVPIDERDVDDTYGCVECAKVIMAQSGAPINANQAATLTELAGKLVCRECRTKKAAAA